MPDDKKEEVNLTPKPILTVEDQMKLPDVVDYMTGEPLPKETPRKIRKSPHAGFYWDALKAGWSLRQLCRYADKHFGEKVSTDTFKRLRQLIPANEILPATYQSKKLQDIDAKIDALQELQNVIEVQKQRVTMALDWEDKMRSNPNLMLPMFMKPVREEVAQLWTFVKEFTNVSVVLGILNTQTNAPRITGISNEESNIRTVVNELTIEHKAKILQVIEEIQSTTPAKPVEPQDIEDAEVKDGTNAESDTATS